MRVTQQEMNAGHHAIVVGAAQLMREHGIRGTSVADVMQHAGMTHGGFYRHFESKDALTVAALRAAFDQFTAPLESRLQNGPAATVTAQYKALYLSREHLENPGLGCPMPALGSELGRENEHVKTAFSEGLARVIAALAQGEKGAAQERQTAAAREVAMLVGAMVLARACDGEMRDAVLAACRE